MSEEKSQARILAERDFQLKYSAACRRFDALEAALRDAEKKVEEFEKNPAEWINNRELFFEALNAAEGIKEKWRDM